MMEATELSLQDSKRRLPDGWRWVRLEEVIREAQGGFASGERAPNGVIQLRMNNVTNRGQFDWASFLRVPADSAAIAAYRLEVGDVLFNNTNSTDLVGKTALFKGYREPVVFSNHFTRLRTIPDLLSPDFLALWLRTQWQQRVFANICNRWIGQSAVQRDKLLALEIPLPPLAEQKRIAAILNEQMAAVERARVAAEAQLELAASLIESYLRQSLFNGRVRRLPLRDCLQEVSSGVGAAWKRYPVIGATRDGIAPAKESVGKSPERYKLVEPGTIFYNPMRILIGSIAMIDEGEGPGITSPDYVVFKTKTGILHPRWVYYWLRSSYGQAFIKSLARGAVRERMLFRRLVSAEIDVPSWESQVDIAEKLKSVAELRRSVVEQLDTINKLPAAFLRRAFSGEL